MESVLLYVSLFLAQQWGVCAGCNSLSFSVDLGETDGAERGIIISITNSGALCNATQAAGSTMQPLVRVATCPSQVHSADFFLTISHSFLSPGYRANTNQTDTHAPYWMVNIPDYLKSMECIEVSVKESVVGAGMKISGTRTHFWLNPPNLSTFSDIDELCSQSQHGSCRILDTSVFEWTTVALVKTDFGAQVHYMDINNWQANIEIHLPNCTCTHGYVGVGTHWELIEDDVVCGDPDTIYFNASKVYALSKNKLFILGNGLLYSLNKGSTLYQLLWPDVGDGFQQIKDFVVAGDVKFAVLITSNQSSSIWLGFSGETSVVQVYPSALVDSFWESKGMVWNDSEIINTTLEFDGNYDLYLVNGNHSFKLPLNVILNSAATASYSDQRNFTNSTACASSGSWRDATQRLPLVQDSLHELTHCRTDACSFAVMSVEATQCGALTRSKLHIMKDGALQRMDESLLPERNCAIVGDTLPGDLFLGRGENYNFTVKFILSRPDPTSLHFLTEVSNSETVGVRMTKLYESASNILSYEVCLEEKEYFSGQFSSGYTAQSIDIRLQVFEAQTKCVDTFSENSLQLPGRLQTRVHVGCPPGLQLKFDAGASSSQYSQHCEPVDNVTCYYYANEFHPVLLVVDAVTEVDSVYTGPYTMTALAGGTTLNNIRYFNKTWRSSLWTPVHHTKGDVKIYYHNDSGIKWVCGTTSPCGEIIPDNADSSEYFLLLEATNRVVAENETYCELSVQFLIRVHGMGMGAITTVVTLLIILVVLSLHVGCCFAAWHFRLKLAYCKDRFVENSQQRYSVMKQRILEHNRKQRATYEETELKDL